MLLIVFGALLGFPLSWFWLWSAGLIVFVVAHFIILLGALIEPTPRRTVAAAIAFAFIWSLVLVDILARAI